MRPTPDVRTVIVAAAIVIEDGRVLLSRRKAGTHLEGAWEFPGGKVEPGEDPRAALARELAEELGVEATATEIVDVTFHHYADAAKSVLLLFFEATRSPSSPPPRALDVAEIGWFTKEALDALGPNAFPPADVAVLAKVRARL